MDGRAPNYEEFSASRRRKRAVQESTAAVTAAEAAAAASLGPAGDEFLSAATAQSVVLILIALQLFCLLYELLHPLTAGWAAAFSSRPGLAGGALLLSQALPPLLAFLRQALAYLVLALWLASFAEAVLFLQACWASRGKRGFTGLAVVVMERPLRAVDAMAVLLLGSSLLFNAGPRAFARRRRRRRRRRHAPLSVSLLTHPHPHTLILTHTRARARQWGKRCRCCCASSAWRTLCSCCSGSWRRGRRRARGG